MSLSRDEQLARQRGYWHKHREKRLAEQAVYHARNKDRIAAQQRAYRERNKEVIAERNRAQYLKNKDKRSAYGKAWNASRWASDPLFRLKSCLRTRTAASIRRGGYTKKSGMIDVLGCDWEALKSHIEAMFSDGMSWDNYGKVWVIDHHVPIASASDEASLMKLCHYTNLRPLGKTENLRKAAKLPMTVTLEGSES